MTMDFRHSAGILALWASLLFLSACGESVVVLDVEGCFDCGGLACCQDQCVDLTSNAEHCGSCGASCDYGEVCASSRCVPEGTGIPDASYPFDRDAGAEGDSGVIVNPETCAEDCAALGKECCGTQCFDLDTDQRHCGDCDTACVGDSICEDGSCRPKQDPCDCPAGQSCNAANVCVCDSGTLCGSSCVDIATDKKNCGGCGNECPTGMQCRNSACACADASLTKCGASCVNIATDSRNCGGCGYECSAGMQCRNMDCACTDTSLTKCGSSCVNTKTDMKNCGGCGIQCGSGQSCTGGSCVSNTPQGPLLSSLKPVMRGIFEGTQVVDETAMFIDRGNTIRLLYDITGIDKVMRYDGTQTFTQGTDFVVTGGKIQSTSSSSMPHITSAVFHPGTSTGLDVNYVHTYWGEGPKMTDYQVKVTYRHAAGWSGFKQPTYAGSTYQKLIQKLQKRENITVIFYGDSITNGANASYHSGGGGASPQHPYTMLFTEALADLYGYKVNYIDPRSLSRADASTNALLFANMPATYNASNGPTITYVNTAIGGWNMYQGQNAFEQLVTPYVQAYGCDLFVLAYGMNLGEVSSLNEMNIEAENMLTRMNQLDSDAVMALVSTMWPNPEATNGWLSYQPQEEASFASGVVKNMNAKGVPTALCQMTSMSKSVLDRKSFKDYSGNNINHPNDFFVRIYAQTLLQTVVGYENLK